MKFDFYFPIFDRLGDPFVFLGKKFFKCPAWYKKRVLRRRY